MPDPCYPFIWYSTRYFPLGKFIQRGQRSSGQRSLNSNKGIASLWQGSPWECFARFKLPHGRLRRLEQTLRMLVSIRRGMFLEPVSQIVSKEVVRTVEMNVSVAKTRLIAEVNTITAGTWVAKNCEFGRFVPVS